MSRKHHSSYFSIPCINGLIGTWSFRILDLANILADRSSSSSFSTVIPNPCIIVALPSLAPINIICAFW